MIRFTVQLASGARFAFERESMPRHWKSWVMRQCPYGTDFTGAVFAHKPIGTPKTQRLRKLECDAGCDYIAYVSRRWIAAGIPACPCGGRLIPADPEDARLVLTDAELADHPAVRAYNAKVASVRKGQGPNAHKFGDDHYVPPEVQAAKHCELERRAMARTRQLAAIRPASDPIPF